MTVQPHTHAIVNGRVLLPDMTFRAKSALTGKVHTFTYSGILCTDKAGNEYVVARNSKGGARYIAVSAILLVERKRRRAA